MNQNNHRNQLVFQYTFRKFRKVATDSLSTFGGISTWPRVPRDRQMGRPHTRTQSRGAAVPEGLKRVIVVDVRRK